MLGKEGEVLDEDVWTPPQLASSDEDSASVVKLLGRGANSNKPPTGYHEKTALQAELCKVILKSSMYCRRLESRWTPLEVRMVEERHWRLFLRPDKNKP